MFAKKNKRPAAPKGQGAAAAKQASGILLQFYNQKLQHEVCSLSCGGELSRTFPQTPVWHGSCYYGKQLQVCVCVCETLSLSVDGFISRL